MSDTPYNMPHWNRTVYNHAHENVQEWGEQDTNTLLLAMQEELGELTQAYLEYNWEDGDEYRVLGELVDLTALCIQLQWKISGASVADTDQA